jgi:uncharacterized membrane protein YfcA
VLNSFPVSVVIGLLLGILAGLGTGGGSLLLLWLTLVQGIDSEIARTVNLLFFLTSAAIVSILRLKSGNLSLRKILPGILAGCVAAASFSILGRYLDTSLLKKGFGVLLIVTGTRELFYRPRKAR